jgi:hypothetical protein
MRYPCSPTSDPMLLLAASFLHFMLAWFCGRFQCNASPNCNEDLDVAITPMPVLAYFGSPVRSRVRWLLAPLWHGERARWHAAAQRVRTPSPLTRVLTRVPQPGTALFATADFFKNLSLGSV